MYNLCSHKGHKPKIIVPMIRTTVATVPAVPRHIWDVFRTSGCLNSFEPDRGLIIDTTGIKIITDVPT